MEELKELVEEYSEIENILEDLDEYDIISLGFNNGYDAILWSNKVQSLINETIQEALQKHLEILKNKITGGK